MSRDIIEHNIGAFLELESSEILAVYGGWGVGKTYIWNEVRIPLKVNGNSTGT